jgi:hypothetical protein
MSSYDIVSNSNFTISMLTGEVSVGRILPNDLKSCAWPLLKAMFGGGEGKNRGAHHCRPAVEARSPTSRRTWQRAAYDYKWWRVHTVAHSMVWRR